MHEIFASGHTTVYQLTNCKLLMTFEKARVYELENNKTNVDACDKN